MTRSYRVKVGLTEWPEAMRLGATVTGQANMLETAGIPRPATALTTTDNKPAVWVVDPKSMQVSLRSVELRRQGSSSIVVSRGFGIIVRLCSVTPRIQMIVLVLQRVR